MKRSISYRYASEEIIGHTVYDIGLYVAAERMQVMVNGLLELCRINARGGNFMQIDLNGVVYDVVCDLEARIRATNAQVKIGHLPDIEADE